MVVPIERAPMIPVTWYDIIDGHAGYKYTQNSHVAATTTV